MRSIDANAGRTLVLASASPRRRDFVGALGVPHDVLSVDADERALPGETAKALVRRLSWAKAQAGARLRPDALILAADTIVVLDGEILGKPRDASEARAMLRALRNRAHEVISALVLYDARNGHVETRHHVARVVMRNYSDDEIEAYVASGDPFDKAGAYAVQHKIFAPASAVEGCQASVMGLPLAELRDLLAEFGIPIAQSVAQVCRAQLGSCCQDSTPTNEREL